MPGETLRSAESIKQVGQEHLFQYWGILTPAERQALILQMATVNFEDTNEYFKKCFANCENGDQVSVISAENMKPVPKDHYGCKKDMSPDELEHHWNLGLEAVASGKVGALLLAGGQGTRLGVSYPKGMYNVGLPSGKVLYQIQAERIRRLQTLAKEKYPDTNGKIMWYIMTSEATDELTEKYFLDHSYFGLDRDQVVFFEQGLLPCYDFNGKIIMETRSRLAMAPDGNGGLYRALRMKSILDDIDRRGVQYLHVYGVDNILVRVADPEFIGYCIAKNADCGNKVVEKVQPNEPVGVVCWVDDVAQVVEYSEISPEMAQKRDEDGRLTFRAGNIANHFFTSSFLRRICQDHEPQLVHHVAKKKIPHISQGEGVELTTTIHPKSPNGIKMEKFVFDVFPFARNFYVYEVPRESEFSPLKNATGIDSPDTCRRDLFEVHRKWLTEAGGKLVLESDDDKADGGAVEISPLLSYKGENLENVVNGKEYQPPVYLKMDEENGVADKH